MKKTVLSIVFVLVAFTIASASFGEDFKCQAQLDAELQKLAMGTSDQPATWIKKYKENLGGVQSYSFRIAGTDGTWAGSPQSVTYFLFGTGQKGASTDPVIFVTTTDAMGASLNKKIQFDKDCGVVSIGFSAWGSSVTPEINGKICTKILAQLNASQKERDNAAKELGLDHLTFFNLMGVCATTKFSGQKENSGFSSGSGTIDTGASKVKE